MCVDVCFVCEWTEPNDDNSVLLHISMTLHNICIGVLLSKTISGLWWQRNCNIRHSHCLLYYSCDISKRTTNANYNIMGRNCYLQRHLFWILYHGHSLQGFQKGADIKYLQLLWRTCSGIHSFIGKKKKTKRFIVIHIWSHLRELCWNRLECPEPSRPDNVTVTILDIPHW